MTPHPEDTPINRFFAFFWGLAMMLAFGVLIWIVAGLRAERPDGAQVFNSERDEVRAANLSRTRAEQVKLLADAAVPLNKALAETQKTLSAGQPVASAVPVPKPVVEPPAADDVAEPAPDADDTKTAPTPAPAPAPGKPAETASPGKPAPKKAAVPKAGDAPKKKAPAPAPGDAKDAPKKKTSPAPPSEPKTNPKPQASPKAPPKATPTPTPTPAPKKPAATPKPATATP